MTFWTRWVTGYARLEQEGIASPVTGIEGQYKRSTSFDVTVSVHVEVEEFKGVRLTIRYTMLRQSTGETVFVGKSQHCFMDHDGKPVILKKRVPELDRLLKDLVVKEQKEDVRFPFQWNRTSFVF